MQKRTTLTLAVALATAFGAVTSVYAQDQTPDNNQVEPGSRVGRVFIGDSKTAVHRRLGIPQKTYKLPHGLNSELWRSNREYAPGKRDTLEVVYDKDTVVQIEVTNPIFKLKNGLSLLDSDDVWKKRYGRPLSSTYSYTTRKDQSYQDWKSRGIAIESVINKDGTHTFHTLIVHRKRVAVVPDAGGISLDAG